MYSLKEKTILVTGASAGIGRQCAITASRYGADLILIARDKSRLRETYDLLDKGNHHFISQDITEYDKLEQIVSQATQKAGKLCGFVHSAGIEITLPLSRMKPALYEKLFAVNVIAGFEIARIVSKAKYSEKNGGSFVFIASIMGLLGEKGLAGYCGSKGALISGIRSIALELSAKRIRVNCILPGHITGTKMSDDLAKILPAKNMQAIISNHPLGPGNPDDIANACVFLLSNTARWITGTNLVVDGGYSIK